MCDRMSAASRWSNDLDALRDFEVLSEFTSGRRISSPPIFNSYGRGKPIEPKNRKTDYLDPFEDVDQAFFPYHGIGRGQRLEAMAQHTNKESELQKQLRQALGRGYSNAQIEKDWGHRSESRVSDPEPETSVELTEQSMGEKSSSSSTSTCSSPISTCSSPTSTSSPSSLETVHVPSPALSNIPDNTTSSDIASGTISEVIVPKKPVIRTRKPRNNNALLNGLVARGVLLTPLIEPESCALPEQKSLLLSSNIETNVQQNIEISPEKYSPNSSPPRLSSSKIRPSKKLSPHASEFIPRRSSEVVLLSDGSLRPSFICTNKEPVSTFNGFKEFIPQTNFVYHPEEFPAL